MLYPIIIMCLQCKSERLARLYRKTMPENIGEEPYRSLYLKYDGDLFLQYECDHNLYITEFSLEKQGIKCWAETLNGIKIEGKLILNKPKEG